MSSEKNIRVASSFGDEFQMPYLEPTVIQHIQSFLTRKEAARTTILSKPWHNAWSTNGVLYLDPCYYLQRIVLRDGPSREEILSEFLQVARKSISRYKTMNLKLDELRLWMYIRKDYDDHEDTIRFYDQLVLDALNLGVTLIHITVINSLHYCYTLPPQVFDSGSLKELSLVGCRIGLNANKTRVICSRLVSLKLVRVEVKDDMMGAILSGCPLIEDLALYECRGLERVNLSVVCRSLKKFSVRGTKRGNTMMLSAEFGTKDDHPYPNLISLELDKVRVVDLFYSNIADFSNRFPCMRNDKFKLREYEGPQVLAMVHRVKTFIN